MFRRRRSAKFLDFNVILPVASILLIILRWERTMTEHEEVAATRQEWRDKNRGLLIALSACLALWAAAIWLIVRP